jgi:glutamyl-tRNA synthetase
MMVRVRIGPSPTGDPHVGTAYIALFNYAFAKKHGGKFILRIEDTDRTRSQLAWESMIIESLRWLGLDWDEGPDKGGPMGPYRQSERGAIYIEHTKKLLQSAKAYRCFCTTDRLAQMRQEQRDKKLPAGYDGLCRHLTDKEIESKLADAQEFVVRLKVEKEATTIVNDQLRGELSFDNTQIDDQVLLKSDGMPTYHLANVVDDHLMEISHVIRAEEWISSTPKHVLLYEAFGWQAPEWIHMPLLRNQDKSKISKRKNPVSLNFYREAGYFPDALLNYLGMMGWTMPQGEEKFTLAEMIDAFDLKRVSLGGPVFDIQKLTWLNALYMREQSTSQMVQNLRDQLFPEAFLTQIAPLVHERIDKWEDFIDCAGFFFQGQLHFDDEAQKHLVPKKKTPKDMAKTLSLLTEKIDTMSELKADTLDQTIRQLCEEIGWKAKEVFMPLRIVITGKKGSPPLLESMEVLGKEQCRRRLRYAIGWLKSVN